MLPPGGQLSIFVSLGEFIGSIFKIHKEMHLVTFSAFFFNLTISSRLGMVPPSHPMSVSPSLKLSGRSKNQ